MQDIITLIKQNPDVSVGQSRPAKVKAYLSGEAVRMSRQEPPGIDAASVAELWTQLCESQTPLDTYACLHSKPVCREVATVPSKLSRK